MSIPYLGTTISTTVSFCLKLLYFGTTHLSFRTLFLSFSKSTGFVNKYSKLHTLIIKTEIETQQDCSQLQLQISSKRINSSGRNTRLLF
jgi:hypothetical protein